MQLSTVRPETNAGKPQSGVLRPSVLDLLLVSAGSVDHAQSLIPVDPFNYAQATHRTCYGGTNFPMVSTPLTASASSWGNCQ